MSNVIRVQFGKRQQAPRSINRKRSKKLSEKVRKLEILESAFTAAEDLSVECARARLLILELGEEEWGQEHVEKETDDLVMEALESLQELSNILRKLK